MFDKHVWKEDKDRAHVRLTRQFSQNVNGYQSHSPHKMKEMPAV